MLWEDKVEAWKLHPVTKAFFLELEQDRAMLVAELIKEDDPAIITRLQGMIRAYGGIMDIPADGIAEPDKGVTNVTD